MTDHFRPGRRPRRRDGRPRRAAPRTPRCGAAPTTAARSPTFAEEYADALGPKSSLLVLGDARSNYSDLALPTLQRPRRHAPGTRWWLNPEHRRHWDTGDSAAGDVRRGRADGRVPQPHPARRVRARPRRVTPLGSVRAFRDLPTCRPRCCERPGRQRPAGRPAGGDRGAVGPPAAHLASQKQILLQAGRTPRRGRCGRPCPRRRWWPWATSPALPARSRRPRPAGRPRRRRYAASLNPTWCSPSVTCSTRREASTASATPTTSRGAR